jgi:hypothetical protein
MYTCDWHNGTPIINISFNETKFYSVPHKTDSSDINKIVNYWLLDRHGIKADD